MSGKGKPVEGGDGNFELLRILLRGTMEWNIWRAANPSVPVDLQKAALEGVKLDGANLKGANLEWAYLKEASLEGANLEGTNLEHANLQRANLKEASLSAANLSCVNLREGNLERADLERADLSSSYLSGANLKEANLKGADLAGAFLKEAEFKGADLKGASLEDASYEYANLDGTSLDEVIFMTGSFSIFTESDSLEDANELLELAKAFSEELGFVFATEGDWVRGSLWKRAICVAKGLANHEKVMSRTDVAEYILLWKRRCRDDDNTREGGCRL